MSEAVKKETIKEEFNRWFEWAKCQVDLTCDDVIDNLKEDIEPLIEKARRDFALKLKIRLRKFTDEPFNNIKEGTTENDIENEIDKLVKECEP